jgi:hypothetical protein
MDLIIWIEQSFSHIPWLFGDTDSCRIGLETNATSFQLAYCLHDFTNIQL